MLRLAVAAALLSAPVLFAACSCAGADEGGAGRKIDASLAGAGAARIVVVLHEGSLTEGRIGELSAAGIAPLLRLPGVFTAKAGPEDVARLAAFPWVETVAANPDGKFDVLLRSRLHQLSGTAAGAAPFRVHGECAAPVDQELRGALDASGARVQTVAGALFTAEASARALYRLALLEAVLRLEGERELKIQH
jgi:hypothetical protein